MGILGGGITGLAAVRIQRPRIFLQIVVATAGWVTGGVIGASIGLTRGREVGSYVGTVIGGRAAPFVVWGVAWAIGGSIAGAVGGGAMSWQYFTSWRAPAKLDTAKFPPKFPPA
jgi:hypothetical protein